VLGVHCLVPLLLPLGSYRPPALLAVAWAWAAAMRVLLLQVVVLQLQLLGRGLFLQAPPWRASAWLQPVLAVHVVLACAALAVGRWLHLSLRKGTGLPNLLHLPLPAEWLHLLLLLLLLLLRVLQVRCACGACAVLLLLLAAGRVCGPGL